ncbi:DRB4 protein, partial [Origma solitaria]|nr:DRB4 protein [Origma solitaria]
AVLVALVVLGAPTAAGAELSGIFQEFYKCECHFINGTEKVRLVVRLIYSRVEFTRFNSDVGLYVGFSPYGVEQAKYQDSDPVFMETIRTAVEWYSPHNYKCVTTFSVERRGER